MTEVVFTCIFSTFFFGLCPLVWSIEIGRGRENEKVGGKQAKLNERERAAKSYRKEAKLHRRATGKGERKR